MARLELRNAGRAAHLVQIKRSVVLQVDYWSVVVGNSASSLDHRMVNIKFEGLYFHLGRIHQEMEVQRAAEGQEILIVSGDQLDGEISFVVLIGRRVTHSPGQTFSREIERNFFLIQQQFR